MSRRKNATTDGRTGPEEAKRQTRAKAPAKPRAPRKPRAKKVVEPGVQLELPVKAEAKPRKPRAPRKKSGVSVEPAPAVVARSSRFPLDPGRQRVLYLSGSIAAILFLVGMLLGFSVDYPYYDQWDFVPFLEKAHTGQLTWGDFWAQHNEHRLVFPRLVLLALALWSRWDIHWEMGASLFFAVLTWAVICAQAKSGGRRVHEGPNTAVLLMFTLLVFSMSQWQNWFLGWQVQEFMNVLAAVLTFVALSWGGLGGLVLAGVCAVVASFSFANGVLAWPVGLVMLLLQYRERGRWARFELIGWIVAGVVVTGAYLRGYETPAYHPGLSSALGQPLECVLYVLAYLGQPVWNFDPFISLLLGGGGVLLWLTSTTQLLACGVPRRHLLPWFGMALYAVATAAMTALGRVDSGLDQAMSSRYVTMANLLWVAVAVQSYWAGRVSDGPLLRRALPYKVGVLCALLVVASLAGAYRWAGRCQAYRGLRVDVLQGFDEERLRTIYPPNPQVIVERREVLRRLGLGIFPETQRPLPPVPVVPEAPPSV